MFLLQLPRFNYFAYCYVVSYSPTTDESISTITDGAIHQLTRNNKNNKQERIKTDAPAGKSGS